MTYGDARAFRAALEERLRQQARASGRPLDRVRKEAAAQRLLARLAAVAPEDSWVLKGGLALIVRMGDQARATRDADATWRAGGDALHATLEEVVDLDAGDWFRFEIARARELVAEGPEGGLRFPVVSRLDGRLFEPLTLDVNLMPDDPRPAETIVLPNLFEFAGFEPVEVPIVPPGQHLAEKLHAYVRNYGEPNSRAKDLYDMLAIADGSVATDRGPRGGLPPDVRAAIEAEAGRDLPRAHEVLDVHLPAHDRKLRSRINEVDSVRRSLRSNHHLCVQRRGHDNDVDWRGG